MTLKEQVYAQAVLLAGELEEKQKALLELLCAVAVRNLAARLREGLRPENCKADFVAAASLYALAALGTAGEESSIQELKAGDLTVRQGAVSKDAASRCLARQAELLIRPYLRDSFAFTGV